MKLTFSQTLELLGKIASVNERLRTLLDSCDINGGYDDLNGFRDLIYEVSKGDLLRAEVSIVLDCANLINTVKQIVEHAEENRYLVNFLDASKIHADLVALDLEIKRKNKL